MEIPSDAILIAEALPMLRLTVETIEEHLEAALSAFPDDLRTSIRGAVASALCAR